MATARGTAQSAPEYAAAAQTAAAQVAADPVAPLLIATDEGRKVQMNNGNMFIAVFRKRANPAAPRDGATAAPLPNAHAAAAAAAAGYTPKPGGELRGNTW